MKEKLLGKTPGELKEIALECGLPGFAGGQIAQWLYRKRVRSIGEMTNLSKTGRDRLEERYEAGVTEAIDCQVSKDGTKKYLFPAGNQAAVEAVLIPEADRRTLCVSSQAGCKMGCRFCMTGRQGFHGNLSAADMLSQLTAVEETFALTNAVFMGMGEPLDNWESVSRTLEALTAPWGFAWSPKRITLSTVGVLPALKRYLDTSRCHLAVSLHNPFPDERASLMPIEQAYPLRDIVQLIRQYDFTGQRRVSFEYILFSGFNDTKRHADALACLLRGMECRVNLIRFHQIPDVPYKPVPASLMEAFRDRLNRSGVIATIRASRGEDILAACGLLAGKHPVSRLSETL